MQSQPEFFKQNSNKVNRKRAKKVVADHDINFNQSQGRLTIQARNVKKQKSSISHANSSYVGALYAQSVPDILEPETMSMSSQFSIDGEMIPFNNMMNGQRNSSMVNLDEATLKSFRQRMQHYEESQIEAKGAGVTPKKSRKMMEDEIKQLQFKLLIC